MKKNNTLQENLIVFGDAYGALNYTIYFIHSNINRYNKCSLILFDNKNYREFAQNLNQYFWNDKLEIVYLESFRNHKNGAKKRPFDVIEEMIYLKKLYTLHFRNIENSDIYYSVRKHISYIFHFVAKLSENTSNRIFLCDADQSTINKRNIPTTPSELLYYLKNLILYNRNLIFRKTKGGYHIQTSERFLKKYNITSLERNTLIDQINSVYNDYKQNYTINKIAKKVLFFDQNVGSTLNIPLNELDSLITKSFNTIFDSYTKEEAGFKYHPTQKGGNTILEQFCEEIPTFIPGEFLYNKNVNIIISFFSNILAENKYSVSISLLFLLDIPDEKKEFYKEYLDSKSHTQIYYPTSYAELKQIIQTSKKQ